MVRPDARQRKRMYGVWRESGGVVERRRFEVCGVGMCVGVWVWVSGGEGGATDGARSTLSMPSSFTQKGSLLNLQKKTKTKLN